jgi:hypothetical protein
MPKAMRTCVNGHFTGIKKAHDLGKCATCEGAFVETQKVVNVPKDGEHLTAGFRKCACGKKTAGPRTGVCFHCGTPFPSKEKVQAVEPTENEVENEVESVETDETEFKQVPVYPDGYDYPDGPLKHSRLYAPAGECPYRLRANGEATLPCDDAIKAWAFKVRNEILKRGDYITNEGLLRWARNEVNYDLRFKRDSEEMLYLRDFILNQIPDIQMKKVVA